MMKITAGLGSIDDYPLYVQAGADEVFAGYMPYSWNLRYGNVYPLNRREVLYYNVSIGTKEDIAILYEMYKELNVPVTFAFNALYYTQEQYKIIDGYISDIRNIGFGDFIIADIGLIAYLYEKDRQLYDRINVHLSGECMEYNTKALELVSKYNIRRYIFHRKNTFSQMRECIDYVKKYNKNAEFEAFLMNEKCHYNGSYCNSLHCDELAHLCMIPYETGNYDNSNSISAGRKAKEYISCIDEDSTKSEAAESEDRDVNYIEDEDRDMLEDADVSKDVDRGMLEDTDMPKDVDILEDADISEDEYVPGMSGCGLCAAKTLDEIGITNLKVVGRGAHVECMIKDIETVRKTLDILDSMPLDGDEYNEDDNTIYRQRIIDELFDGRCSRNCYYIT